jgi:transposase
MIAAFSAREMLTQEQAVEIRVMARQGMGIRQIARELGCSRNTVRRYLQEARVSRYGPRQARSTKLDPFKQYLRERIEAAKPHWIPAVVLLREIRDLGYAGGLTQLKLFINPLKQLDVEPVVRFETPPGRQMQADFTVIRRGRDPLLAFVATLGYSRASFVRFTTAEDADTLCACVREALNYFGGVPRHILFDNAKTVVVERDAHGEGSHRWHAGLLSVAEEFGFRLRVCRPYRAKTKGKVERFNGYLKGSFLVPLAATLKSSGLKFDAVAANVHIGRWLSEVANARIHATTKERPDQRLALERAALLPLPSRTPLPQPAARSTVPLPVESLQHPLSVYAALVEVPA